ncbi:hypothetical protein BpHYR1_012806 [Brachionus plicatilis]|uniref:Uncharacterized protein n=1 Tax=Brachionus plicatilis TaxID=10195 RepID=A0A3M7RYK1_BRAPC|nr:hypothetical protein BpHYR1_012806 [Brachionus plicatilis]
MIKCSIKNFDHKPQHAKHYRILTNKFLFCCNERKIYYYFQDVLININVKKIIENEQITEQKIEKSMH